jgi:exosortase/archaeosortase family protein
MRNHLLAAIGFAAAFHSILLWYARRLSDGSDEPLGLAALSVAGMIAWTQRERFISSHRMQSAAILFLLIYGITAWFNFPPLLRSIPALAAVILWYGIWRLPSVVILLVLSLPIMASLQFYLGYPLRLLAAEAAHSLLSLAQINVWRDGVELISNGTAVGVDPPCSGLRMLWASSFLAIAVAGKFRLGWRGTITLGGLALLMAIATNTLRVSLLFFPEAGLIHLPHWTHEATGLLCFALGVLCLVLSARKLQSRFAL